MASIPITGRTAALQAVITVTNSDGTQTSDSFLLDKIDSGTRDISLVQTHEIRANLKGGQANSIKVTISKSGTANGILLNAIDIVWEALKR
jgi:hypothetical protein